MMKESHSLIREERNSSLQKKVSNFPRASISAVTIKKAFYLDSFSPFFCDKISNLGMGEGKKGEE